MTDPVTPLPRILQLARSGSSERAWELFIKSGWDKKDDDARALTLKARLLKDQAKQSPEPNRVALYREAAATYIAAATVEPASYPMINAASLALLSGDMYEAKNLAQRTLDLLDANPDEAETPYWLSATRSEALLLLGKNEQARNALDEAVEKAPQAWEDHAATIGQFGYIISKLGGDASWLDAYRPPATLHFSGLIGLDDEDGKLLSEIQAIIESQKPAFGFGALAAGADIIISEMLIEKKAELHVVLPYPPHRFHEVSVLPFGKQWSARYERLMAAATTVHHLEPIAGMDERPLVQAVDLTNQAAMGMAIRHARTLHSEVKAVTVVANGETPCPQQAAWEKADREMIVIETKRVSTPSTSQEIAQPQDLRAILWVDGDIEESILESIPGKHMRHGGVQACHIIFEGILAAYNAAITLIESQPGISIGLTYDVVQDDKPSQALLRRIRDYATTSSESSFIADHRSAMALVLAEPGARVGEIGEIKTAWGTASLWTVA